MALELCRGAMHKQLEITDSWDRIIFVQRARELKNSLCESAKKMQYQLEESSNLLEALVLWKARKLGGSSRTCLFSRVCE